MDTEPEFKILPMFEDAFIKVGWAKQCAHTFNNQLDWYVKNCIKEELEERQPGKSTRQVLIEAGPLTPLGLPVGDIIRNLRGAMDATVSAVYRQHGKSENHAYWPFGSDRTELKNRLTVGIESAGFERLVHFFLDEFEFTKTGDFPLWALNQIDRNNKHRNITVIATLAIVSDPSFYSDTGSEKIISIGNRTLIEPGGRRRFNIPADAILENGLYREPTLQVKFGPKEIFADEDVVPILFNLCDRVLFALKSFQTTYVAAYPN